MSAIPASERLAPPALLAALFLAAGAGLTALVPTVGARLVFLALLILLTLAACRDLVTHRLPDGMTAGVAALALVSMAAGLVPDPALNAATALLTLGALWAGSTLAYRRSGTEALGLGDVKLLSAAALLLGPIGLWMTILLGAAGGIAAALATGRRRLPFGPFLAFAMLLSFVILSRGSAHAP